MKPYVIRVPVLVLLCLVSLCGCSRPEKTPEALVGIWEADGGTKYRGASFEITNTEIIFRKEDGLMVRNRIKGIESTGRENGAEKFDIQYRDFSGGEHTLSIAYFPKTGKGAIRFRYQPKILWSKTTW